jgi:hypothetical protein
MGPSGAWMMYDVMTDAIMINALMQKDNYYYDDTPTNLRHAPVHHASFSFIGILFKIVIVIVVIVFIGFIVIAIKNN